MQGHLLFGMVAEDLVPQEAGHTGSYARVLKHYNGVIMSEMASQITGVSIVCSTLGWGAGQRKHHSSASLGFVQRITGEFPTQKPSNAESVSIWWRHHEYLRFRNGPHHPRVVSGPWGRWRQWQRWRQAAITNLTVVVLASNLAVLISWIGETEIEVGTGRICAVRIEVGMMPTLSSLVPGGCRYDKLRLHLWVFV